MKAPSALALLLSFATVVSAQSGDNYVYKPKDPALYDTIVHMDSVYFNAYNSCDMPTQAAMYSDSIEFYHDGSGLERSKQRLLQALKDNICGKVTRVLVKGSIEVYPIPNFGAVEIGLHRFINHQENNSLSKPDKFILIWRHTNGKWLIYRVISLHMGS
jgi:hypothetical protein